jgi:hypothetical protein
MALLSLPNELLGRIVEKTMPEGFGNFVLSCKAVYQAGTHLIEEHNTLRRRYRHFRYEGDGNLSDQDTCASSLQLIARIAEDPRIAKYIAVADFKADGRAWKDGSIQKPLHEHVNNSSEFRALLEKSTYLRDTGDDASIVLEHLTAHFEPYKGTHILAATLLLTLLPNVTQLSLPKRWELWGDSKTWDASSLLDAIVKRANDPRDSAAGLSKLDSILPSIAWGYDTRWKLSTFIPFLSIESVRKFCAGSTRALDNGYRGYPFEAPKYETFGRGLEVVELVAAVVDAIELRKFLSRIPRLKAFRLKAFRVSYETQWSGCGPHFDASAVM